MQAWSMAVSMVVSLILGVTFAVVGSGLLGSFFGVFVGVFTGYGLIIALSHFCCLLLPRFRIGTDSGSNLRKNRMI